MKEFSMKSLEVFLNKSSQVLVKSLKKLLEDIFWGIRAGIHAIKPERFFLRIPKDILCGVPTRILPEILEGLCGRIPEGIPWTNS